MIRPPGPASSSEALLLDTGRRQPLRHPSHPASVGLACRPVGAWRRHLMKQRHSTRGGPGTDAFSSAVNSRPLAGPSGQASGPARGVRRIRLPRRHSWPDAKPTATGHGSVAHPQTPTLRRCLSRHAQRPKPRHISSCLTEELGTVPRSRRKGDTTLLGAKEYCSASRCPSSWWPPT
jgi:hypothetical protein